MSQDVPQYDGFRSPQTEDGESLKSSVASQGIDALRRAGALFVNLLRLGSRHPQSPLDHRWTVVIARRVRIDVRIVGLHDGRIDRRASSRGSEFFDVAFLHETAVDEHFSGCL